MFGRVVSASLRAAVRNARPSMPGLTIQFHRNFSGGACRSSATAGKLAAALLATGSAISLGWANEAYAAETIRERTLIAIKPDGVHRGLIAEIIKRFESKGYKLVGIKLIVPTADLASSHYAEHEGKPFFPKLVNFLSSGPVLAMVWEGDEVIKYGRTMIGATNPLASAPGTIRGDYACNTGRNIIHGSDSVASAQKEIALWFRPEEIASWTPVTAAWTYE